MSDSKQQAPCKNCGACPCCGRGGFVATRPGWPYPYPYPYPYQQYPYWWTNTTPPITSCVSASADTTPMVVTS